jgi:hypothetical protein
MKKITLVLAIIYSSTFSFSQEEKEPLIKNEIGINTIPLIKASIGVDHSKENRYALSYKRVITPKSAIRVTAIVGKVNPLPFNSIQADDTVFQSPTGGLINYKENRPSYFKPQLNIGYERRFGKKNLNFFYGADLIVGGYQKKATREQFNLISDTLNGGTLWTYQETNPKQIGIKKTNALYGGVNSFFGVRYNFSKHFLVSAQLGVNFTVVQEKTTETDALNNQKKYTTNQFDFTTGEGFINDISFVYRF